jgi:predicted transporter
MKNLLGIFLILSPIIFVLALVNDAMGFFVALACLGAGLLAALLIFVGVFLLTKEP